MARRCTAWCRPGSIPTRPIGTRRSTSSSTSRYTRGAGRDAVATLALHLVRNRGTPSARDRLRGRRRTRHSLLRRGGLSPGRGHAALRAERRWRGLARRRWTFRAKRPARRRSGAGSRRSRSRASTGSRASWSMVRPRSHPCTWRSVVESSASCPPWSARTGRSAERPYPPCPPRTVLPQLPGPTPPRVPGPSRWDRWSR